METGRRIGNSTASQAVTGGLTTGWVALLAGVFAALSEEPVGAGLCLAAAGIAFGLVANAMLRR